MTIPAVGVVGSGFIARQHLRAWHAMGARIAIHSQDGDEAGRLAARYGARHAATLDELLELSALVDVCTPTDQHGGVVAAAADEGRDVICEKPLARTAAEAAAIARRCERAGVRLFPAHVVRYVAAYETAHREVRRGTVGEVAIAHYLRSGPRPRWSAWFDDVDRSGGLLMDLLIHDYDIAQWLAGPVVRLRSTLNADEASGVVVGTAILTHASGAVSHVQGMWGDAELPLSSSFRIYGDAGCLRGASRSSQSLALRDPRGAVRTIDPPPGSMPDPFGRELADFARVASGGGEARVSAADGVAAVGIAEAAVESARSGDAIAVGGVGR